MASIAKADPLSSCKIALCRTTANSAGMLSTHEIRPALHQKSPTLVARLWRSPGASKLAASVAKADPLASCGINLCRTTADGAGVEGWNPLHNRGNVSTIDVSTIDVSTIDVSIAAVEVAEEVVGRKLCVH